MVDTPCITQTKYALDKDGYPRRDNPHTKNSGSLIRYLWEEKYGILSSEMVPDHLCKNKACINLEHIEIVNHRINTSRATRKLTEEQVLEIKKLVKDPSNDLYGIAAKFDVTYSCIYSIRSGKTWSWLKASEK